LLPHPVEFSLDDWVSRSVEYKGDRLFLMLFNEIKNISQPFTNILYH
jgi:hypothetical protein